MRVLIAGATGAIGRPLVRYLSEKHHTVFALARSPESSRAVTELGAEPVIADALDLASVKAAIARVRPDAVINELTSLPRRYTAAEMQAAAERDRRVRIEGNTNLLAALRDAGVRRYVLQSGGLWYAPGDGLADESAPFAFDASPAVAAGTRRYAEMEAAEMAECSQETIRRWCGDHRIGKLFAGSLWLVSRRRMLQLIERKSGKAAMLNAAARGKKHVRCLSLPHQTRVGATVGR